MMDARAPIGAAILTLFLLFILWGYLNQYSGWTTIQQVFVESKFVGGCDILEELNERGDLGKTLNADEVTSSAP